MPFAPVPKAFARITRSTLGAELPTYLDDTLEAALSAAYFKILPELKAEKTIGAKGVMRLAVVNSALLDVF